MEFQEGFSHPYFRLMEAVLNHLELGLPAGNKAPHTVHYFHLGHDTWVKLMVDSIVVLTKPLQTLFFKGINVTSYPSFDHHFTAASTPAFCQDFNFCASLLQEQTYIRQA